MKELAYLRNIGIMAHIDAGKTTTTERILFLTERIGRVYDIDQGKTQMDWMEQERERGITITAAATTVSWKKAGSTKHTINIIDTPGHVDFTVEVERSLRVLDGAIVVLDAQVGIEPQTETVWRQATKHNVPRIFFLNKMDKLGADPLQAVQTIKDRLNVEPCLIQLAIGRESNFRGIIDLVEMKQYIYTSDKPNEDVLASEIASEFQEEAKKYHHQLLEQLAHFDDEIMLAFLENQPIAPVKLRAILRRATLENKLFPVLLGSSFKNKGVRFLLDAVIDYLPSPIEVEATQALTSNSEKVAVKADENAPFVGLVFKLMTDPFVGKMAFCRIYSGTLKSGSYVLNTNKNTKERIGRLMQIHSNSRTDIPSASAGDIVGIIGLRKTITGETITALDQDLRLEKMEFPEPVISLALEPKTKADQEKMSLSLQKLAEEDPTFHARMNYETNQMVISGMGELHLEIIVDRLKREFRVDVNVGLPQVSYRETIYDQVETEGKYIRQSGGRGQYGHVMLKFASNGQKGNQFINKITGGRIPREYIKPIEDSLLNNMNRGVIAGYPLINVQATLYDGSFHEVDSSEFAFKTAAALALQQIKNHITVHILEPIMKVDVTTPKEYYGDVIGDLASRRARVENTSEVSGLQAITAFVPLQEMFNYATNLRSFTQGRGNYVMQFASYEKAPQTIAEEIVKNSTFSLRKN